MATTRRPAPAAKGAAPARAGTRRAAAAPPTPGAQAPAAALPLPTAVAYAPVASLPEDPWVDLHPARVWPD